MSEIIGFLGGLLFAISAIPMTYQAIRTKEVHVPWPTIGLVFGGASCMLVYGVLIHAVPLICDMLLTATCWGIMGGIKYVRPHS